MHRGLALFMLGALLLTLAGGMIPATKASTSAGPIITTYSVPINYEVEATGQVPAANGTAGTANLTVTLPFVPSSSAEIYMYYKLVNSSSGAVLSSASNVNIKLLDANGATVSTILLSSSPGEAIVPLSGTIKTQNLTIALENSNTVALNATVKIIVMDIAKFNVTVSPQQVNIAPGDSATITVSVTQTSGPMGVLTFNLSYDGPFTMKVNPDKISTSGEGAQFKVYWYITAYKDAKPGTYTARLIGTFDSSNPVSPPDYHVTYTFAEIAFPIAVEIAAAGAGGFALGSIFGASFGWWAVAAGIIILIIIVAVAVRSIAG